MPRTKRTPETFADRIVRFEKLASSQIAPHPENWRVHPESQIATLRAVLASIGKIGVLIVRETQGGKRPYQLVDGEARLDLDGAWWCAVTDLSEDEARQALLTYDPIAAMAEAATARLQELHAAVGEQAPEVEAMLERLRASLPAGPADPPEPTAPLPPSDFPEFDDDIKVDHQCPKCGYEWSGPCRP